MFGAGVVSQHTYNVLRTRPAMTAALGTPPRIKQLAVIPQGLALPAALHYAEAGTYSGPITTGLVPMEEEVRYVVRFVSEGESDTPIRAAAKDALLALAVEAPEADITQDGEVFHVSLLPSGEWPVTTLTEGGVIYRQLGFFLAAFVSRA